MSDWIEARIAAKGEITRDEMVRAPAERHGITVHRRNLWRFMPRLGLTHKKDLSAPEQKRKDVAGLRFPQDLPVSLVQVSL